MRVIVWLMLILLAVGGLASEVPLAETQAPAEAVPDWRRTRNGWEHSSRWTPPTRTPKTALHPAVVGLLEMFLAAAALVAFSGSSDQPPPPKSRLS